jgi:hypothetical protein
MRVFCWPRSSDPMRRTTSSAAGPRIPWSCTSDARTRHLSLRMSHRSWGIMMIQANISAPFTALDFRTREAFARELTSQHYDVVGISSITTNIGKAREMCRMVRKLSPDSTIVLGGHVTAIPAIESLADADHYVRGEGISWMRRYPGEDLRPPRFAALPGFRLLARFRAQRPEPLPHVRNDAEGLEALPGLFRSPSTGTLRTGNCEAAQGIQCRSVGYGTLVPLHQLQCERADSIAAHKSGKGIWRVRAIQLTYPRPVHAMDGAPRGTPPGRRQNLRTANVRRTHQLGT